MRRVWRAGRKGWCQALDGGIDGVVWSFVEVCSDEKIVQVAWSMHAHDGGVKTNPLFVSCPVMKVLDGA